MAIDQRDVSSALRFMKDDVLRQYAAMHKNDPYIFPLAFQESQNRQKLRMQQQAQAGAMPQPKVNEQALAQMAPQPMPEDRGIATLAAPNMQQMADGGIAGYPDDANFAARSEPVVMMAEGGVARYQVGGTVSSELQSLLAARERYVQAGADTSGIDQAITTLQARMAAPQSQASYSNEGRNAPAATTKVAPTYSPDDYSGMDRRIMSGSQLPSIQSITPPAKATPRVDTERRAAAPVAAPTTRPAAPEQTAAQRYAAMQKGMEPERAGIDKGIAALGESMRKTAKGELEDFEKDVAERGVAFKGREERLAKREAELGKRKGDLGSFAMLEFGLGLLAEPGNFAAAVGRVGQRTAASYNAGLKDLRAAQEKMDDARDQIEEFRRTEDMMTAKERRQFKNNINRTETEIEKLGLQAAEKMYGYKREDAKAIFAAETQERLTDKEIQGRLAAARISAAPQTPAQMQIALALGKGDLEAGLNKMRAIEAGKFSVSNSYADYLKAFAGKETITPPLSFANYAAQFGAILPR